jgi:large conductance mechanosensitive channel
MRGSVIDLAVAVVIGAACGAVVTALVKDLITPLIAAIAEKPDFSAIIFEVNKSKFMIGDFINAVVSFLLISAAISFFVVVPVNALTARMRRGEAPPDPTTKKCPECLSEVPVAARRCAFCASSRRPAGCRLGAGRQRQGEREEAPVAGRALHAPGWPSGPGRTDRRSIPDPRGRCRYRCRRR